MTRTIIPRPIAWVLSENKDLSFNLAPFSYFNAVCSDPPLLMISMGKKPTGDTKDTATNLQVGAYCTVHIANASQADMVTATAATLEYGENEADLNNIELCDHNAWPIKRIKETPIAYLCKVHSRQEIGNTPQQIIFLEAQEIFLSDDVASENDGRISVNALDVNPLARLGASQYANLGDVFTKTRPK
jgi:flavin reductase (DIM6/NTAB) family NADH-FMN oxidoreductase RutF